MEISEFCEYIKEIRSGHLFRNKLAEKYPWHLNTIRGYESEKLCNLDYLAVLSYETGSDFNELAKMHLRAGSLKDSPYLPEILSTVFESPNVIEEKKLKEIIAIDDSLDPTISIGATMFVDTEIKTLEHGGVYCFKMGDEMLPRRVLSEMNGRIVLATSNTKYRDTVIDKASIDESTVVGKVCSVLNSL
ncbi:MAG: hypothetical protein Alis3KO_00600 [Aliiglaciecola sp.]